MSTSKPSRSEHVEQREFVSWWRKNQPDIIMAIPNGGARNKATAAKMKVEGQYRGAWDLFAPERALWIEMKVPGGRLSPAQREFGERMEAAGYRCIVAWGCDDAIAKVDTLDTSGQD